jgi:hypothetical protein
MIRSDTHASKGIVWLASYPKSGNTWLRIFLYQLLRIATGRPQESGEINHLERASVYESRLVALFERFLGRPLAEASFLDTMRVRPTVQALIAEMMPITGLVKTHNLLGSVKDMPTINAAVTAGAIYVVRDPRDVALSLSRFLETDVDHAIEVLNTSAYVTNNSQVSAGEIWGNWSEHARSWTDTKDATVLVVRYEDMLAKPSETFVAVSRHLRLPVSPVQVNEAVALASFDHLRDEEERLGFVERTTKATPFFASGKSGVWRQQLKPQQAKAIVAAHGETMARFGYPV